MLGIRFESRRHVEHTMVLVLWPLYCSIIPLCSPHVIVHIITLELYLVLALIHRVAAVTTHGHLLPPSASFSPRKCRFFFFFFVILFCPCSFIFTFLNATHSTTISFILAFTVTPASILYQSTFQCFMQGLEGSSCEIGTLSCQNTARHS